MNAPQRHQNRHLLAWAVREPLLHFVAMGAMIFIAQAWLNPQGDRADRHVELTGSDMERLRATARQQWGKEPDSRQLDDLVQSQVREEILYREALASGLDRDDMIVRRRLAQKMEFLAHEDVQAPSEKEMRQYLSTHMAHYMQPATVDFEHRYFGSTRHGATVTEAANRARQALAKDTPVTGDNFMLGHRLVAQEREALARDFGQAFAEAVFMLPVGVWSTPVASAHGLHLVRVLRHQAPAASTLEEVRDKVAASMVNDRVLAAREAAYQRMRARYTVVLPEGKLQLAAAPGVVVRP